MLSDLKGQSYDIMSVKFRKMRELKQIFKWCSNAGSTWDKINEYYKIWNKSVQNELFDWIKVAGEYMNVANACDWMYIYCRMMSKTRNMNCLL